MTLRFPFDAPPGMVELWASQADPWSTCDNGPWLLWAAIEAELLSGDAAAVLVLEHFPNAPAAYADAIRGFLEGRSTPAARSWADPRSIDLIPLWKLPFDRKVAELTAACEGLNALVNRGPRMACARLTSALHGRVNADDVRAAIRLRRAA